MRVDTRAGSGPLIPLLQRRGVRDVEPATLLYGDIAIDGNGPEGMPVAVGVEYKKLGDMLQCIDNGRFVGHQLPGMLDCYNVIWLVVEGIWRENPTSGILEVPRGPIWSPIRSGNGHAMASSLVGFLMTMEQKVGIRVMRTGTQSQTLDWLFHLNRWWTSKAYEEHRAHLALDNSQALALIRKPNLVQKLAQQLPGIGWDKAAKVGRKFASPVDMILATESEWMEIEGIGKGIAEKVVKELHGD